MSICWNVFHGLKPYALRWLRSVRRAAGCSLEMLESVNVAGKTA